jgi:hypothetical protein
MSEDLALPMIAAVFLLWYLARALHQWRTERSAEPTLVWREATIRGWSEWRELSEVAPSADYSTGLAAVRSNASTDATAVQYATVAHPSDAPDYTLRVLFMSAVREPRSDRGFRATG